MNGVMFAALCIIWGSTWMAIKVNITSFPPFYSAALRFLMAGTVLYGVMRIKGVRFPHNNAEWRPAAVFGILNGVSYGLIYWGEQYISSGLTAVLNASLPFFSIIFAYCFIGEGITPHKTVGTVIGFLGVVLLFCESLAGSGGGRMAGELAIVAAAGIYAAAGVYMKKHSSADPLVAVTVQMFGAAAVLLAVAVPVEHNAAVRFSLPALAAFLYLSLVGSALAFYIYNRLLLRMEVSRIGYISLVTPAVATVLGVALLREELEWQMLAGMVLILAGTAVISVKNSPEASGRRASG